MTLALLKILGRNLGFIFNLILCFKGDRLSILSICYQGYHINTGCQHVPGKFVLPWSRAYFRYSSFSMRVS